MPLGNKDVSTVKAQAQYYEAVRKVLSFIGDKWSVLIIIVFNDGPFRFNELRHTIDGILQRMLTRTLRSLERSGILSRTVEPTVYYALTLLGKNGFGLSCRPSPHGRTATTTKLTRHKKPMTSDRKNKALRLDGVALYSRKRQC